MDTGLSREDFARLTDAIRKAGCIPMATPFDEASVDQCVELGLPILKLASSDLNDWVLIEKMATTKLPVIASTGGSSLKDIDDLVTTPLLSISWRQPGPAPSSFRSIPTRPTGPRSRAE